MKRVFTAAFVALSLSATASFGQTSVPSMITNPDAAATYFIDVTILRLSPRDYGYHVHVTPAINMTCFGSSPNANGEWPLVLPSQPQYKAFRESLQITFAMKRKIRIYTSSCVRFGDAANAQINPQIFGLDVNPQ